jgi:hypothetical protein
MSPLIPALRNVLPAFLTDYIHVVVSLREKGKPVDSVSERLV